MKTVYCICGLGSDERIFRNLNWGNAVVHYLNWQIPLSNESFSAYARRMSERITEESVTLVGVSFGGMLSIEIAKIRSIQKVILISSIKNHNELPVWMKVFGKLNVHSLLPQKPLHSLRPMKLIEPIENYFLGAETEEEKKLVHEYRKNVDPVYLRWSIHQILNWKNDWQPETLYHIHGNRDKIFPYSRIKPTHTIDSGGHFLIYQQADMVSSILNEII